MVPRQGSSAGPRRGGRACWSTARTSFALAVPTLESAFEFGAMLRPSETSTTALELQCETLRVCMNKYFRRAQKCSIISILLNSGRRRGRGALWRGPEHAARGEQTGPAGFMKRGTTNQGDWNDASAGGGGQGWQQGGAGGMAQPGSGGGGFVQGQPGNFGGQGQMGVQMGGGAGYGQPPIDLNNPMFQMAATSGQQFFDNGAAALQAGPCNGPTPRGATQALARPRPFPLCSGKLPRCSRRRFSLARAGRRATWGSTCRWGCSGTTSQSTPRTSSARSALAQPRQRDTLPLTLALHCMRSCVRALKPVCPRRATAADPAAPVPPQDVGALKRRVEQRAGVRRAAQRPQLPRPLHPHDGVRDLHRPLRAPPGLPRTEREAVRSGRKRRS